MTLLLSVISAILLVTLSTAKSQGVDTEPWELSWPFFEGEAASHSIIGGYGDWCDLAEGLHPGLDFGAEESDIVLLPTDETREVIYLGGNSEDGFCMVFGENSSSTEGWGITHLDIDEPDAWPFEPGSVVDYHQPLSKCKSVSAEVGLHMHLQWIEFPVEFLPPGLHNPFDYFVDDLAGYDEVQFNPVKWEEYLSPPGNRGIWFIPDKNDGAETYIQFPGGVDPNIFQNIISGAVDIAVAPFSAFQGLSDRDSAGVYSVSYEILRQDPVTLEYLPAASGAGNFGERFLMEMRDELPYHLSPVISPEYRAIYSDGLRSNSSSLWIDPNWKNYLNAYIVTNSGSEDPSAWASGFDNVWTDAYNNDWVDGICRGAWDTFLAKQEISGDPAQNSEAFFPDGRYAVKITAVSHSSASTGTNTGTMTLPVDDPSLPDPQTEGVVVDNFLPHIIGIAAYAWDPATRSCDLIYEGYWEDIVTTREMPGESEYLEHLRADLHALQSEDRSDSLSSFNMVDVTESSNQSFVNQIGFSESERTSEEYSDIMSTLEPGSCLDDGIGQDPVDFLMNEITRIENQYICDTDANRTFGPPIVYEYLPMNGSSLVLQVFYSEPTMVENLSEDMITDRLYFKGIIGGMTTYNSTRFGYFERLPSNFQLPLIADNALGSLMGSNTVDFDDSYVVHYLFNGTLPQQYVGNIQLFLGGSDLGSDEGPRDLAGNQMDSNPGTTAQPRSDYGPFSYIGFETGPDINHAWEPPNWFHNTSTDIVYGFVGSEQDLVAAVNLNTIGLADCQFLGDCDYWCGFWLFRQISGTSSYVYIVKPDGYYLQFRLRMPGMGATGETVTPEYVIGDGRYCWLTGFFGGAPDHSVSGTNAYRVDALERSIFQVNVCAGSSWEDGQDIFLSAAWLTHQYANGQAQFYYGYFTTPWDPGSGVSGYVTLPSVSTYSIDATLISNDIEIDVEADIAPILEIQGNPISSSLGIICNSSTAHEYELVIYDIAGRRVLVDSGVFTSTDSRVDIGVSSIPSGVYLVRLRTGDTEVMRTISIIH